MNITEVRLELEEALRHMKKVKQQLRPDGMPGFTASQLKRFYEANYTLGELVTQLVQAGDTSPLPEPGIKEYLDGAIAYWRTVRDNAQASFPEQCQMLDKEEPGDAYRMAVCYIDALQSVRHDEMRLVAQAMVYAEKR